MSVKIFEKIEKEGIFLLRSWKVDNDEIKVKRETKGTVKVIFDAKKNGVLFRLTFYAILIEDVFSNNKLVHPTVHLNWKINFIFIVDNPDDLSLSVSPESFSDKLFSFLGNRDKELYNKKFDDLFFVKSNHDFAYAQVIDERLQNLFVENIKGFSRVYLRKNEIRYEEPFNFVGWNWKRKRERFIQLLSLFMMMSENVNKLYQD